MGRPSLDHPMEAADHARSDGSVSAWLRPCALAETRGSSCAPVHKPSKWVGCLLAQGSAACLRQAPKTPAAATGKMFAWQSRWQGSCEGTGPRGSGAPAPSALPAPSRARRVLAPVQGLPVLVHSPPWRLPLVEDSCPARTLPCRRSILHARAQAALRKPRLLPARLCQAPQSRIPNRDVGRRSRACPALHQGSRSLPTAPSFTWTLQVLVRGSGVCPRESVHRKLEGSEPARAPSCCRAADPPPGPGRWEMSGIAYKCLLLLLLLARPP